MKNQSKFHVSLQPPLFTINSPIAFPSEKFLTDNFRTYGLRDRDNLLENVILDILKKVMPTVPFSVTTNAVPYF